MVICNCSIFNLQRFAKSPLRLPQGGEMGCSSDNATYYYSLLTVNYSLLRNFI